MLEVDATKPIALYDPYDFEMKLKIASAMDNYNQSQLNKLKRQLEIEGEKAKQFLEDYFKFIDKPLPNFRQLYDLSESQVWRMNNKYKLAQYGIKPVKNRLRTKKDRKTMWVQLANLAKNKVILTLNYN